MHWSLHAKHIVVCLDVAMRYLWKSKSSFWWSASCRRSVLCLLAREQARESVSSVQKQWDKQRQMSTFPWERGWNSSASTTIGFAKNEAIVHIYTKQNHQLKSSVIVTVVTLIYSVKITDAWKRSTYHFEIISSLFALWHATILLPDDSYIAMNLSGDIPTSSQQKKSLLQASIHAAKKIFLLHCTRKPGSVPFFPAACIVLNHRTCCKLCLHLHHKNDGVANWYRKNIQPPVGK